MRQRVFNVLISLVVCGLGILQYLGYAPSRGEPEESLTDIEVTNAEPTFFDKSPEEGLMEALEYYGVKHPNVVYAQAILETGHFRSKVYRECNNLFGLYNSRTKSYYKFDHWSESVVAYLDFIQYKYKPPNDYYKFLSDIGYAEDPEYINKLKRIVNRNDKRRTSDAVTISNQAK